MPLPFATLATMSFRLWASDMLKHHIVYISARLSTYIGIYSDFHDKLRRIFVSIDWEDQDRKQFHFWQKTKEIPLIKSKSRPTALL